MNTRVPKFTIIMSDKLFNFFYPIPLERKSDRNINNGFRKKIQYHIVFKFASCHTYTSFIQLLLFCIFNMFNFYLLKCRLESYLLMVCRLKMFSFFFNSKLYTNSINMFIREYGAVWSRYERCAAVSAAECRLHGVYLRHPPWTENREVLFQHPAYELPSCRAARNRRRGYYSNKRLYCV